MLDEDMREKERIRGVSLVLVLTVTIATLGVLIESLLMGWESWGPPFLILAIVIIWAIHIRQSLSTKGRTYVFAFVTYAVAFYHGIHPSSIFDIALIMSFLLLLFSTMNEEKVIHIGLFLFFFLMTNQIWMLKDVGNAFNDVDVARIIFHCVIVLMTSQVAMMSIRGRRSGFGKFHESIRLLEETNRSMEDFMANVSHELRTPINVVTGLSKVLMESRTNDNDVEKLTAIYKAGHRLSGQVADLLDHTEIDTGKAIIAKEPYTITSALYDVLNIINVYDTDSLPEIVVNLEASVPSVLNGDVQRIKKIIWHLLDNAIKFTRKGGVYLHVSQMPTEYGINLAIDITDTGRGMTEDEKNKIMNGLYQVDSGRNRETGGVGLGLSIVYGFVHMMGGFVTLNTKEGEGTKIHVSIPQEVIDYTPCMGIENTEDLNIACYFKSEKYEVPLVRDFYNSNILSLVHGLKVSLHRMSGIENIKKCYMEDKPSHLFISKDEYMESPEFFERLCNNVKVVIIADESLKLPEKSKIKKLNKPFYTYAVAHMLSMEVHESPAESIDDTKLTFPNLRALVVDDEDMNLVVAGSIFRNYGMVVDTAASGRESIMKYTKTDYDIIFMDHMMPEMDGVEAVAELRRVENRLHRNTIIVALTANAVSGAKEMFLASGFDGFVAKPIEIKELERVLCRLLPGFVVRTIVDEDNIIRTNDGHNDGILADDPDLYEEMKELFLSNVDEIKTELDYAYRENNPDDYICYVRSIRDMCRIIGDISMAKRANNVEALVRRSGRVEAVVHRRLREAFDESVTKLEVKEKGEW